MAGEIVPMSEWAKAFRKEVPAPPAAVTPPAVQAAPPVVERVVEKPVFLTPEEREKLRKIVTEAYEIAKKTGERVLDVLKRKVEEWKKAREEKKLKEAVPEAKKEEVKVAAVPEKEYVRLVEVKE
jgi:pyruvate-formate lyase-activating enzyme